MKGKKQIKVTIFNIKETDDDVILYFLDVGGYTSTDGKFIEGEDKYVLEVESDDFEWEQKYLSKSVSCLVGFGFSFNVEII